MRRASTKAEAQARTALVSQKFVDERPVAKSSFLEWKKTARREAGVLSMLEGE